MDQANILKATWKELSMEECTFKLRNPEAEIRRQRQTGTFECQANLVYIVSSSPTRATE